MNEIRKLVALFLTRLRYPFSTPEEVAADLGLEITNQISFQDFVHSLTHSPHPPTKIAKYMSRESVEKLFISARHKEIFRHNTLISYYFNEGWMELLLDFDAEARLRRLYVQHKELKHKVEIPIKK